MTRVFDADARSGDNSFGDLPEWDLTDLYSGQDAPELERDFAWLEEESVQFAKDYQGKLGELNADEMLRAVLRDEKISSIAGRIMAFAGLQYYQITTDAERGKFLSDCQDRLTNATTPLVFYSLELNQLDEDHLQGLLDANADLKRYQPIFDRLRAMKPHQLSDELEKFLHDQSVVGSSAWNKLFDETIAALEFEVNGNA